MQNKNSHTLFDFMYPSGTNELWQDIVGYEDGGFVGYQYGGGATIESIMEEAGMTMTPEQRAQFENPDPTTVNRIAEDIQSGMEASGRGSAESVAGQGFIGSGHGTKAMADVRSEAVKRLGRATEDYQKGLASDTLGTAAGMVAEGAEFGQVFEGGIGQTGGNVGWPNIQAYDSWVAAGRPEPAVQYGFAGGGDPNISPGGAGDYSSKQSPYG